MKRTPLEKMLKWTLPTNSQRLCNSTPLTEIHTILFVIYRLHDSKHIWLVQPPIPDFNKHITLESNIVEHSPHQIQKLINQQWKQPVEHQSYSRKDMLQRNKDANRKTPTQLSNSLSKRVEEMNNISPSFHFHSLMH